MRSNRSLALEAFSEDFGRRRSTLPDVSGSPPLISILADFKTRLRVARARGVPRAQCLRGARLDTRFLGVRILSHVLRHAATWFNARKGYGFLKPGDGGFNVYVHISAVERAGMMDLKVGQKINFEMVMEPTNWR